MTSLLGGGGGQKVTKRDGGGHNERENERLFANCLGRRNFELPAALFPFFLSFPVSFNYIDIDLFLILIVTPNVFKSQYLGTQIIIPMLIIKNK